MMRDVPLAWLNLTHNLKQTALSVAGLAFAVLLMFMETGFRNAMFDSQLLLINRLDADIFLISRAKPTLMFQEPFARHRLEQARAAPDVQSAEPVYIEHDAALWKNASDGSLHDIRAVAFEPERCIFIDVEICRQAARLRVLDGVLFDRQSKGFFGPRATGTVTELSKRTVRIVGTFALGTDFTHDGNVMMSADTFFHLFPDRIAAERAPGRVELGVITLVPGSSPQQAAARLRQLLPPDVEVLTKQEYRDKEQAFLNASTPIGYVFNLGTILGFLVGAIICYQVLFTDIANQLPQFATLRAIGYSDRTVALIVLQQAVGLSAISFVPGLIASRILYALIATITGLPLEMSLMRGAVVLCLTTSMCMISGAIAVRKALALAPADLY
ncbi:MAG: ABC transporter permease DevC [Vicinamibacterales bacterium]